jgi:hypothetical protein
MNHPSENDLALLAGGDAGPIHRFLHERHVLACTGCREKVAAFQNLRSELAALEPPNLDWTRLSAEMRANIRVGVEAGQCVRAARLSRAWNPRLTVAFASLLLLVGLSFFLSNPRSHPAPVAQTYAVPVLQSTGYGIELRMGLNSLALLNHHGVAADQSVSATGEIRARYIDGESSTVTINTINNAYLQ